MTAALVEPLVALRRALATAETDLWQLRKQARDLAADEDTRVALHDAEDHLLYVVDTLRRLHARLDPAEAARQEEQRLRLGHAASTYEPPLP